MLKIAFLAVLLFSSFATAQEARLRIASVDMNRLFDGYHRTETAIKEINIEQARILKQSNDRLVRIREIKDSLEKLIKQLEDPTLAESKKQQLQKQGSELRQEGIELERERKDFMTRRGQMLQERVTQQRQGLLAEVRKLVEEEAKAGDYDYVFDTSAVSNSGSSFVISSGSPDNLTDRLLTKLNDGAAKKEAVKPDTE
ncbi:OmpH family outer membrane protein [Luteolibacter arcticus]|uniref:OmpH family outer membrane protein n=1 Tax=Luteolibacter arcticus TaxID=1581411 RepID=A0ABT3GDF1_9BACT|nr:OmpH family outer membrane protein [Luteolibacter arcticus]MCW1921448.1 OmpH family outer membrane protein [Luteolibacter arcticus]